MEGGMLAAIVALSLGCRPAAAQQPGSASAPAPKVVPYVPEPRDGLAEVLATARTEVFRLDPASPATLWTRVKSSAADGILPPGLRDGSSPGADVRYAQGMEDGVPLFQWTCGSAGDAGMQWTASLGALSAQRVYKITFRAKSPTMAPVHLRVRGTPLSDWDQLLLLTGSWKSFEFYYRPAAEASRGEIACLLDRPGEVQVADLSVQAIDVGHLQSEMERLPADNYLDATRFPLGLPPGWYLHRSVSDGDDVRICADRSVTGPSGAPALRIDTLGGPGQNVSLFGPPFLIERFWLPQTVSFSVKGDAEGQMRLVSGSREVAAVKFRVAPGDDWKRVAAGFAFEQFTDEVSLEIEVHGKLWLDALRVGAGPDAAAYVTRLPAEVELAASVPSRVFFADDAASQKIEWAATSAPPGSSLKGKVVDLYGEQAALPAVSLAGGTQYGVWPLPAFPGHSLGAFRVETWIEDGKGARISPYAELAVLRVNRPRYWNRDAPDSPFGVHVLSTNQELEIAKAIGVNWVRLHDAGTGYVGWSFLEPEKGQWHFHDDEVRRYRTHHLMILGSLNSAPAWATALSRVGPRDAYTDKFYEPEDIDAFRTYVRTVVARYKDAIRTWEVWNEPWGLTYWKNGFRKDADGRIEDTRSETPEADYVRLTQAAWDEVKEVDPAIRVVGFNTTAGTSRESQIKGDVWTRSVLDAGGRNSADIASYHQYLNKRVGYAADPVESGYRTAVGALLDPAARAVLPVWMTEGSPMPGQTGRGFYCHTFPFPDKDDPALASDQLDRYVTALLAQGVGKVFLYSMHKYGHFDNGSLFRLLLGEDGYPHPTAAAYAALAWRLEDKRAAGIREIGPDLRAYLFAGANSWVAVMVPRPGTDGPVDPSGYAGCRVADLYGNPLEGSRAAFGGMVFYVEGDGSLDASPFSK